MNEQTSHQSQVSTGSALDLSEEHARQLVEQINVQFGRAVEQAAELQREQEDLNALVAMAYSGRAWQALGYATWEEMCEAEFSAARMIESVGARRERVTALIQEGLSSRAVGAVLGVSYKTVQRDAVAGGTDVPPATRRGPVQGVDGKAYRRPTQVGRVERVVKVAELAEKGLTQAEIGAQLGVSQRTISTDQRTVQDWQQRMSDADRARLVTGQMSRSEVVEQAGLELSEPAPSPFPRRTDAAMQGLVETVGFIRDELLEAPGWDEQFSDCATSLAAGLVMTMSTLSGWLKDEIGWGAVDAHVRDGAVHAMQQAIGDLTAAMSDARPEGQPMPEWSQGE